MHIVYGENNMIIFSFYLYVLNNVADHFIYFFPHNL